MRIVIHQPYFLPWLGYFSKLAFCDALVVLDDVDFRKRHYYDRTRIIDMHGQPTWINLPVGQNYQVPCNEVRLTSVDFLPKLLRTITQSYARGRFFESCNTSIVSLLRQSITAAATVAEINTVIIAELARLMDLPSVAIYHSSELPLDRSSSTARIESVCATLGADELLIGAGNASSVHDFTKLEQRGVIVLVQDYLKMLRPYSQTRRRRLPFVSGLSAIDAIYNTGFRDTGSMLMHSSLTPIRLGK